MDWQHLLRAALLFLTRLHLDTQAVLYVTFSFYVWFWIRGMIRQRHRTPSKAARAKRRKGEI